EATCERNEQALPVIEIRRQRIERALPAETREQLMRLRAKRLGVADAMVVRRDRDVVAGAHHGQQRRIAAHVADALLKLAPAALVEGTYVFTADAQLA